MSHWFFFLENVRPSEVQIGNEMFGHFPGTDDGINSINELVADDAVTKSSLAPKKLIIAKHQSLEENTSNTLKDTTEI